MIRYPIQVDTILHSFLHEAKSKFSVTPFFLSSNHDNPMIVYIDEAFRVMMARAADDEMEDMLFTGGDRNDQGFLAWKRIK